MKNTKLAEILAKKALAEMTDVQLAVVAGGDFESFLKNCLEFAGKFRCFSFSGKEEQIREGLHKAYEMGLSREMSEPELLELL